MLFLIFLYLLLLCFFLFLFSIHFSLVSFFSLFYSFHFFLFVPFRCVIEIIIVMVSYALEEGKKRKYIVVFKIIVKT